MKHYLKATALSLALLIVSLALFSCGLLKRPTDPDEITDYYDEQTVYAQALSLGYTGTLEEFIDLISGRDGENGKDGKDGQNGKDGVGIKSSIIDQNGHLIFVLTDGTTVDAGELPSTGTTAGSYKVTFDYGFGYTETVTSKNFKVERPEDPTKEGYEFVCWTFKNEYNDNLSFDNAWFFDAYAVTSDMTLYAYWQPVSGGDTPDTPITPAETVVYDGSEVTITFYHSMGASLRAVLDEYIALFNELYPNITVLHESQGGYNDVLDRVKVDLSVGAQPNIAYCYSDHVAIYNLTGKVIPLDNYIASTKTITRADGVTELFGLSDAQINNFVDAFYQEGAAFDTTGTMYALPLSKSTDVLYYNKTLFEENNLTVPTTWEELMEVSSRIMAIVNDPNSSYYNPNAMAFGYDSEANWFITLAEQLGSDYTKNDSQKFYFNNDTNRKFVAELREYYDMGYFTTLEIQESYTSELLTNTSIYMSIASSAGASYNIPNQEFGIYPFEVGVAPLPQIDVTNPKAISQGPSLCMFDQENKQEVAASWLFVKFLTTNLEFQAAFSMASGYMPVIEKDVIANAVPAYGTWLETGIKPGMAFADAKSKIISETVNVALSQQDAYFVSPAFVGSRKARDVVGELMVTCFTTQATDIDAMIKQKFEAAIAECEADA